MDYRNDLYIIDEVIGGNRAAFSQIVDRYKDKGFNLAFRICGNREDAEEVTQDAFLKVFKALKTFKRKSSFSTWFFRIVYNTSISKIRSVKKGILSLEDFPAEIKDFATDSTSDESAEAEYRNSLVNFALQKMNDDDRALITLCYYEEMSADEISVVTGITKSNIKVKLFRARQKMLEIIERVEKKNIIYHEQVR